MTISSVTAPSVTTTSTTQSAGSASATSRPEPVRASVLVRVGGTEVERVPGGGALPFLRADDLGVLRGDGVFEALLAVDRVPWHLDEHLTRLQSSAEMVDLTVPPVQLWRLAVARALAGWSAPGEATVRLVATRGPEEGGAPTAYVLVTAVSATITRERREGITVCTLERGLIDEAAQRAPWLLLGAKTLSYAMNMAAKRWAHGQGVDDALFVLGSRAQEPCVPKEPGVASPREARIGPAITDASRGRVGVEDSGWRHDASPAASTVLEAPTAALVIARGDMLLSPPRSLGILPSITLDMLFANARAAGWQTAFVSLSLEDVHGADGAWLVSSIRLAARIRELDGRALKGAALEPVIADLAATPPRAADR